MRFETRLPNARNESGLGLDTTDFFFSILAGKTIGSVRIVGNAGIGILGNPLVATIQSDAFRGGLSVAYAVTRAVAVVGEVRGQEVWFSTVPPPARSHSEKSARAYATLADGFGSTAACCLASRNAHRTSASSPG